MNRTLRFGSVGDDVRTLQNGLNVLVASWPALETDGIYGPKTTARVREFQSGNGLVPDGVVGPLSWTKFFELLDQATQGGVPTLPETPPSGALDMYRGLILTIAKQHEGIVDFSQLIGGRPMGIDFLIQMFQIAAGVTLTDANFIDSKTKGWTQQPWVSSPDEQRKSWCGIFCVYCYKMAGFSASWDFVSGRPNGPFQLNGWSPDFVAKIQPADIGCVQTKSHHFLIESVDSGKLPPMTTIDGNQEWGQIIGISSYSSKAHRVGKDNFNYYSIV